MVAGLALCAAALRVARWLAAKLAVRRMWRGVDQARRFEQARRQLEAAEREFERVVSSMK
jgi:hypothetical protein